MCILHLLFMLTVHLTLCANEIYTVNKNTEIFILSMGTLYGDGEMQFHVCNCT